MDAAAALVAARRTRTAVENLSSPPATRADAYAIQARVADLLGIPVVGYKVGAASAASQKLMGSGPFAGRIFANECFLSPVTLSAGDFFMVGMEGEFAFRLGSDLPPRDRYTRQDLMDCIADMIPIIEICDTRLADWRRAGTEQVIADNAFCGAIVLGAPVHDWRAIDFLVQEGALAIDGVELGRGTGELVQGHPLDSAAWLANELAAQGIRMKAGELIAAGTCTGLHMAKPGNVVISDFAPFGTVQITVKS